MNYFWFIARRFRADTTPFRERDRPFLSATSVKRWTDLHIFTLLRLVEDDTAALRGFGQHARTAAPGRKGWEPLGSVTQRRWR
jgi:hypothetical protein